MHRSTDGNPHRRGRLCAASLALLLCCGAALALPVAAAPDEPADALLQLVHERDLSKLSGDAAEPPGLARQVRDRASDMVLTAMNFLGVPYRRGGNGDAGSGNGGFDCSGFTRQIFKLSLGRVLPRRADEQASSPGLLAVRRDELRTGDLVFFNTLRRTFSHVGIYIGDGKFIHSPSAGGSVRIEDMGFAYWRDRFTGARRLDAVDAAPADGGAAEAAAGSTDRPAAAMRRR